MQKMLMSGVVALAAQLLMADALQDALDNTALTFASETNGAYWVIDQDATAQGGTCLKCGPLQAGQSATIKTQVPAGKGVLFYKTRFNSTSWGGTDFSVWIKGYGYGYGTSRTTSWYENTISFSDSDAREVSFKLQPYSGDSLDGQVCWLDDVKWLTINEVLGKGLEFDVDDGWSIQTVDYTSNPQAIRCVGMNQGLQAGEEQCISTVLEGPGTLRFRHYGSIWYQGYQYAVELDEDVVIQKSSEDSLYGSTSWDWKTEEIPVLTKGSHEIRWTVSNSSQSYVSGNIGICDVEWIPAPAEITIEFDGEGGRIGGESRKSASYPTGEKYGILPVPVREGQTFEGWFTSGGVKVVSSDYVMPGATNLFARWSAKLEGVSNEVVRGNSEIYSDEHGVVFPVAETDPYSFFPASRNDNYFEVECEGEAIVSFDWVVDVELDYTAEYSHASAQRIFTIDGKEPENIASRKSDKYFSVSYRNGFQMSSTDSSSRLTIKAFLTPGRHILRWSVPDAYGYNYRKMRVAVENFSIDENPVANRESLFDWAKLCREYLVWKPGNLAYLEDKYSQRIAANPNDYDAYIWRALTKVARLGENAKAREIISRCGYAVADYTFYPSGEFVGLARAPLSNDVIDEMTPEVLAALGSALDDVKVIPENWNGRVQIHPEDFGSTVVSNSVWNGETLYYGLAEVSLLRAGIEGALAVVKLARGYDYAADYVAISNACEKARAHGYTWIHEAMEVAQKVGSIRKPAELIAAKEDFRAALNSIKRADQAVWSRDDYQTYILEYDLEDREEIIEVRKIYDQVLASLDVTNKVDITWFVNQYDSNDVVRANAPGGLLSRDLFLGALFAGTITRDLVPNATIDPVVVDMDTVQDFTLGGLFPDVTFSEVLSRVPFSQMWSAENYVEKGSPALLLETNQVLTLTGIAKSDGEIAFTAAAGGSIVYTVDGKPDDAVSVAKGGSCSRAISARQDYSMTFTPSVALTNTTEAVAPVSIEALPDVLPNTDDFSDPYNEVVDGIVWTFIIEDGEAKLGTGYGYWDHAVATTVEGELIIPEELGGCPVTAILDSSFSACSKLTQIIIPSSVRKIEGYAFEKCAGLQEVIFMGDCPDVGEELFYKVSNPSSRQIKVTRSADWSGVTIPGTWQGFAISYMPWYNDSLVVTADKDDWSSFVRTTSLSLSAPAGCAIYYTLDGSEPTTNSAKYSAPIVLNESKCVSFFAFETATGDWGPVDSLMLLRASGEDTSLVVTPNEKDGTRFLEAQEISFAGSDGKMVWYTLDGSDPRTSGTRTKYEGPFVMNETAMVRYYAVDDVTGDWGAVESAQYFFPAYDESLVVTSNLEDGAKFIDSYDLVLDVAEGYSIYYTLDGSTPTKSSVKYLGPIHLQDDVTVKYFAVNDTTGDWSPIKSVSFKKRLADGGPYKQVVDGVEWAFCVTNGEASVGGLLRAPEDIHFISEEEIEEICELGLAIRSEAVGRVIVPTELGGCAVNAIGPYAFNLNGSVGTELEIGESLIKISSDAFHANWDRIIVRSGNPRYYVEGSFLIDREAKEIVFSYGNLADVVIPEGIERIGPGAFNRSNPQRVTFCSTLKDIGASAFEAAFLDEVNLPGGITNIGAFAFAYSPRSSLTIPASVQEIGVRAFYYGSLDSLVVDPGSLHFCLTNGLLCTKDLTRVLTAVGGMSSIEVHEGVSNIDSCAFMLCNDLARIRLPSTVTDIGVWAFANLSITEISLAKSNSVFSAVNNLICSKDGLQVLFCPGGMTNVVVPVGVTRIAQQAFDSCGVHRVDLPESVGEIGNRAFDNCAMLESFILRGDEPICDGRISGAWEWLRSGTVYVNREKKWPKPLPETWQNLPIRYYAIETDEVVVTPSAADGARFAENESLELTLSAGEGQTIWYTTDGSDPMTSATRQKYTGPLSFSTRTTLKYYAVDDVTGDWSAVQTATYYQCLPNGGPYSETVDGITWVFHVVDGEACLGEVPPEYMYSRISISTMDDRVRISANSEVVATASLAVSNSISGRVVIPDVLGSCPVVHVGAMAFFYPSFLTSDNSDSTPKISPTEIVLPATVKGIGSMAFESCNSLETISLPVGITNIGYYAFSGCSSLQDLLIPNDHMVIGDYAYLSCSRLSKIVAAGNAPSVGTSTFLSLSPSCVVYVNKGTTGWGAVPGTWNGLPVKYIDESVLSETVNGFAWNYRDTGVQVILQQDASLGVAELLSGCVEIPAVMNGKAVTVLGKGLLQGAVNVTAVTIPGTVDVIEPSVFRECTRLTSIDLPDGLTSIGDNAFRECVSLTEVTIPASVTNIGYFAFRDCLRLTNVTLLGSAPRQDLGAYMGVPAFTTISGRLGAATAIVYAEITNKTDEVTVPEAWLEELAVAYGTPSGASSYQAAFEEKFGSDLKEALTKPTGKYDLHGNPLYVWQDYVAGTNPLDEEDVFIATITMENGLPVVSWSPELSPERAAMRKYTTWGTTALNGAWVDVSEMSNADRQTGGYQFFKVTVELK